ncbi:MAG: serine hydrolase [bacterium]|nr:serine hydrolase [bacterium]
METKCEWDPEKNAENAGKHGVDFTTAVCALSSGLVLITLLVSGCRHPASIVPALPSSPIDTAAPSPPPLQPERPWVAMAEVDSVLDRFLAQKAFPGGVVAVGSRGALVHLRPFGRLSYDEDSPAVTADTIYDLASLTKVVATTTMAMILVDEGRLDLDKPVQDFLPRFQGPGKEAVTVRHLLTHSSGLDWWGPLYEEIRGKAAYLDRIQAMDLVYEPGTRSKYSDLGVTLLGAILERVAGRPLDAFVRERVFEPLGMTDTLFRPGPDRLERIAPTEHDPWRGRMIRGEVHDENAFAMGGVAPHAGLFGTAPDLARFAQMLLNGGVLEHERIVSRETAETFTRRAGIPGSSRALGWDTKSPEKSSAGSLFSSRSFGHTGFTGTSIWIDPERELFVILLTNRVHPTRENQLIRQVRPAVADAVVRGLVCEGEWWTEVLSLW